MMANRYLLLALTPSTASVAMVKGRMYRLVSGALGTQSSSTLTSALTACTKSSTGMRGMHSRSWVDCIRSAFFSGRNSCTWPSSQR